MLLLFHRFRDRLSKWNPRKLVHLWAEKELHNLTKMEKFGIRVPEPVMLKDHVLVMSFIGKNGVAAPKLKVNMLKLSRRFIKVHF